ncbi:Uncharacterised protein [Salmonella enterica subsp. enterica]|uniref:Uncharacterized protein n=1 Tax=Salmonella enterica I TaxID=59201 RepID=A0A3S4LNX4_SALET|nr:Uncharacterised protein [Salmonella enterica subsp. enterica]
MPRHTGYGLDGLTLRTGGVFNPGTGRAPVPVRYWGSVIWGAVSADGAYCHGEVPGRQPLRE